jgi:hypothetical protein
MSGRVLNFFEFSDKYSTGNTDPLGVDSMSSASANFEEGFDDSTYDQPELGPKRPVAGNYEATPAAPGEQGVPAFSQGEKSGMAVPEETDEDETTTFPSEYEEDEDEDDDSGNPEGEEDAEEDETEEVEESFTLIKGFGQFVNEAYEGFTGDSEESEEEYGMYPEDDDYEGDEEFCSNCGAMGDEYGYSCGCNM